MSEQGPSIDGDESVSGNFYSDLANEVSGQLNLQEQARIAKEVRDENWRRDQSEWDRIDELREHRVQLRLGSDFSELELVDKYYRVLDSRYAVTDEIMNDDSLTQNQRDALSAIGYKMDALQEGILSELEKENPNFLPDKLTDIYYQRLVDEREPELTLEQARRKFLTGYEFPQSEIMRVLAESRGPEAAFTILNQSIESSLQRLVSEREQKEDMVVKSDTIATLPELAGKKTTMPPIEDDVKYQEARKSHPYPERLHELSAYMDYTSFVKIALPRDIDLHDTREDTVLLGREFDQIEAAWLAEFRTALDPLINARYEELATLAFIGSVPTKRYRLKADQTETPMIKLGPAIVPVRAAVEGDISPNWTMLGAKTGSPSSTTTIKDVAFKMLTGKFLENEENGRAEAYRADSGEVVYFIDSGFHRMAAAKLLGRTTRVTELSTRDPQLVAELQQARI